MAASLLFLIRLSAARFWTAPAERSGDGAFGRMNGIRIRENHRAHEGGVALHLPPHSKMPPTGDGSYVQHPPQAAKDGGTPVQREGEASPLATAALFLDSLQPLIAWLVFLSHSVYLRRVKLPAFLQTAFRGPALSRPRIVLALAVAVAADALQIALLPVAWTFAQSAVDVVAMILTMLLIGFHLLLLPTFVIEFIPVADMLPTWTGCVIAVIALRKREQKAAPPVSTLPVASKPPVDV